MSSCTNKRRYGILT